MRSRELLVLAALLSLLGACSWLFPPEAPAPNPQADAEAPAEAPPPPPRPPRKPPVPPTAQPSAGQPQETAKASVEPLPPMANPEGLIGLDQIETEALLGSPGTRTEAAPATIWQYNGRNCELAIYFYLDLKSQVKRALHYEVKSHDPADPARDRCFADLVAQHEAGGVGPPSSNPAR